ncbi:MAG: NEL-type E3 ubiquitin ligase domain-containing protein, partial [Rhodanobacter sp.]
QEKSGGQFIEQTTHIVDLLRYCAGEVDEVDIHLAYQTALANRLDLPWLSDHMLYRDTANVSPDRIQQAYTTVREMGQDDGLVNQMLLEPY